MGRGNLQNRRRAVAITFLASAAAVTFLAVVNTPVERLQLGVGIEQAQDWRTSQIFADMVKQGRAWGSVAEPWTPLTGIDIDSDGWPNGDAAIIMATGVDHLEGDYTLTFTGDATVAATGSSPGGSVTISGQSYDSGTNTTTATVTVASGGVNLWLSFSGEAAGVKNVSLMRPGHTGATFNSAFLARAANFPVLRTMDLTDTNDNAQTTWSTRVAPTYAVHSRNGYGAAWELVIALANQTNKDVWINIPYNADDDYITNLATLFRDNLNSNLKVYVEHSNELWNTLFTQTQDNKDAAAASYGGGDPLDLDYGGGTSAFTREMRYVAYLARRHSELWRAVWGDDAMMTRVRPVLAGHIANTATITGPLAWLNVKYGDPSGYLYGIAAAPYIPHTGGGYTDDEGLDVDDIFIRMDAIYDAGVAPYIDSWGSTADTYGLAFLAYEGGQHITGSASAAAKLAAQTDPRMGVQLTRMFDRFYAAGGDLFMFFNICSVYDSNGYWGLSDDITDQATTKWYAALATIATPVGGTVTASNTAPTVSAGADDTATVDVAYALSGTCNDPDSGPQSLACTWTQQSGAGTCTFESSGACTSDATCDLDVTCDTAESVTLALTGQDGFATIRDTMTLTVEAASTLPDSRKGWWTFEGQTLTDSSGNSNTIDTNSGGDLSVAGRSSSNGAYLTGGASGGSGNSYMNLEPGALSQNTATGYTIAAWFKVADRTKPKYVWAQGISESIFMKYLDLSGTGVDHTILCGVKDADDASPTMSLGPDEGVASNDTWYHGVCVYNKDTDLIRGWINGVGGTAQSVATNFGALKDNPATTNVGGSAMGCLPPSQNCTGVVPFTAITIDDVMVWDRPLTDAEIAELYAL